MDKKLDPMTDALLKNDDFIPEETTSNSQQTAKKAAKILEKHGFVVPTAKQKKILLIAFAKRNKVIYGKAFDILKNINDKVDIDFNNQDDVEAKLDNIVLYEIKSTNRKLDDDFKGFFFALTTAELLVSQNLKNAYRFVFVNTTNEKFIELTLPAIFGRAKGIYPTWSISF